MTGQNLKQFDDTDIGQILSAEGLTVVLLTATWDGNGIILSTIIEGLSGRFKRVSFCVVDFEVSPQLAKLFNMPRPPGLVFVKDGELVGRIVGPVGVDQIEELINQYV